MNRKQEIENRIKEIEFVLKEGFDPKVNIGNFVKFKPGKGDSLIKKSGTVYEIVGTDNLYDNSGIGYVIKRVDFKREDGSGTVVNIDDVETVEGMSREEANQINDDIYEKINSGEISDDKQLNISGLKLDLQEGHSISFPQLRRRFYKMIPGSDNKLKDDIIDAIADAYRKNGVDVI